MTRATNARIAGVTFLVYIAASITSMVLFARATGMRLLARHGDRRSPSAKPALLRR